MLRKLRISLQWATWILLIGSFFLFGEQVAKAAATPFLTNPYYGPALAIYSYFDHDIPTNLYGYTGDNPGVVTFQGGVAQSVRYTGHAGYDYLMNWQPILAAASGSVAQAQWNDPVDHTFGCGLFVKLTHTNITPNHQTLYCHLSAMLVKAGDNVIQKNQIGTSGDTGSSDAPHLHFEVRALNSSSQWLPTDPKGFATGQTDPWTTKSGIQSIKLWMSNPVVGKPTSYSSFTIQDSTTNSAKFKKWCIADATGVNCFWYGANIGSGGHMFYTYTNGTAVDCQAKWVPGASIASSDKYEVFVWIPDGNATSAAVRYTVYYDGGNKTIIVDQNFTSNRWISLGTYQFLAGTTGYVKVVDAAYFSGYTDPINVNKIGVDAIKFIRRSNSGIAGPKP